MKKLTTLLLLLILVGGGFAIYHRDRIRDPGDLFTFWEGMTGWSGASSRPDSGFDPTQWGWVTGLDRITIGSFKVTGGQDGDPAAMAEQLAGICEHFDLTALQMPCTQRRLLQQVEARLNAEQPVFRVVNDRRDFGYVFVYDIRTIELVDEHTYTVNDPEQLFQRPPFVGWFRAQGVPWEEAFTFTVVNYQAAEFPGEELRRLGDLFRAVRDDGRGEDDILLVGDFQADVRRLQDLQSDTGLIQLIRYSAGSSWTQRPYDNLLFHAPSTVEGGAHGVIDPIAQFNWRVADAERLSDRYPIWAEYSRREGVAPPPRGDDRLPIRFTRQRNLPVPVIPREPESTDLSG